MESAVSAGEKASLDDIAALQKALQHREEELREARRENINLRASQQIFEAELRQTEDAARVNAVAAQHELDAARRSLTESHVNTGAVSRELFYEENMRQSLVADHRRRQAATQAEAAAQRAVVAAEIGLFEMASRVQEDHSRQQALAGLRSDAERALVAAELSSTERSLAAASARAARATHSLQEATMRERVSASLHIDLGPNATGEQRADHDGLMTAEDTATGPSGGVTDDNHDRRRQS